MAGFYLDTKRGAAAAEAIVSEQSSCFHCGQPCADDDFEHEGLHFCCNGCLTVHDILTRSGLGHFYDLARTPGSRVADAAKRDKWAYLDAPELAQRLVDYSDSRLTRVTFHIPAIHCIACVWLLENLFQLHPAIGRCTVNFSRREAFIAFATGQIKLSELISLLAGIGYEPSLTLEKLEATANSNPARKKQWLQAGVAGFAFGNIMLFSLPLYLGMDSLSGPMFQRLFGWLSLAIALPPLVYSAQDYWRSAFVSVRKGTLTLDVPIAAGLVAIYAQSVYEILTGTGAGYCDSLTGLIFFLLCGRIFQQATYDRLAFDRDYKSFFPLSVVRRNNDHEETVSISEIRAGDRLILRNSELIPADSKLVSGEALIDYSFVTGESEPVAKAPGDYLYAGGQQKGGGIQVETLKAVSQSYLTSLWNDEAFKKKREDQLNTLTNLYSRRFTRIVLAIAFGAALFWVAFGQPARGLKAFTSVLIVACPCALALAAPFALGTAQRLLGRRKVYLKNPLIIERMAHADAVVFDKTGTLTTREAQVTFFPVDQALTGKEQGLARELARHSTHPHAQMIGSYLKSETAALEIENFSEAQGCGLEGLVGEKFVRLGSRKWLASTGENIPGLELPSGSVSYLSIDGVCRGAFVLQTTLRPEVKNLIQPLRETCETVLLSGDNERERVSFETLFGANATLRFNQSPTNKLEFVRSLQRGGRTVMMIGDGLNDAGALAQSDIGVAVVEKVGAFSPASDLIVEAGQVASIARILRFSKQTARIVRLSFGISAAYNVIGVAIAAAGGLAPIVCAVLMPVSSATVVFFACGATRLAARRNALTANTAPASSC